MRTNRFISPSKPRSIERSLNYIEFDLAHDGVYEIDALNPLETKNRLNLQSYPYLFQEDFDVLSWMTAMMTETPLGYALLKEAQDLSLIHI